MTLCDGTYKNGNACRNRSLPAYTRCGIHGGFSVSSSIRKGNLAQLQHIVLTTGNCYVSANDFVTACDYIRIDIIKFIVDKNLVCSHFVERLRDVMDFDSEVYAILYPLNDLSSALNALSVKSEPCCICLSEEDVKVLVLPCCKNVMCSNCVKSWNYRHKSCAFCRAHIF
jgi:hypothetical protein